MNPTTSPNNHHTLKKVLIIGYVWPEPRSSAAGSRMLQIIELFQAQSWQIVFASPANLSEHRLDLATLGIEEKTIALNCASFDEYLAALNPDMVVFDRFFTEEQFGWRVAKNSPRSLRVLNTEDLHSLRHIRLLKLKSEQKKCSSEIDKYHLGPVLDDQASLFAQMANDDMAQREIAAIYRCDLSLVISQFEMTLLQQQFAVPAALLHYCPFMLPPPSPTTRITSSPDNTFQQRQAFITIGNFRHQPNWDAVLWLKHAIWPLIRQQLPQAQLHIYGAYPPPKATALHNPAQGFHVLGWVDDAYKVMREARVCLAPLRFGAGIKGKLIDAMLCATPSVTTSIGAEAMHGELAWPGAIANTVENFAAMAVALYTDEQQWQTAHQQSPIILQQCFAGEAFKQPLVQRLDEVFTDLIRHRRQNFVGAMLQHHMHKSTQYMAQWIEAKNKTSHADSY